MEISRVDKFKRIGRKDRKILKIPPARIRCDHEGVVQDSRLFAQRSSGSVALPGQPIDSSSSSDAPAQSIDFGSSFSFPDQSINFGPSLSFPEQAIDFGTSLSLSNDIPPF